MPPHAPGGLSSRSAFAHCRRISPGLFRNECEEAGAVHGVSGSKKAKLLAPPPDCIPLDAMQRTLAALWKRNAAIPDTAAPSRKQRRLREPYRLLKAEDHVEVLQRLAA